MQVLGEGLGHTRSWKRLSRQDVGLKRVDERYKRRLESELDFSGFGPKFVVIVIDVCVCIACIVSESA